MLASQKMPAATCWYAKKVIAKQQGEVHILGEGKLVVHSAREQNFKTLTDLCGKNVQDGKTAEDKCGLFSSFCVSLDCFQGELR